jgi:8-oxo-dGTP pyrophosphatase MutT (NUDIX family)
MKNMSLQHQLTENVKLLQKVAIIRLNNSEPEVLLLQRSVNALSRPSCWDLPGGNSEWPSSAQISAANLHLSDISREILEETSLSVSENNFDLDKMVHFSTYFDNGKQIFTVICGWMVDFSLTNQSEIQISDEHQNYIWASQANLANYDFGGENGAFVVDMIQKAFSKFKNHS